MDFYVAEQRFLLYNMITRWANGHLETYGQRSWL